MKVAGSPFKVDDFMMEYGNLATIFKSFMTERFKGIDSKVIMQNKITEV